MDIMRPISAVELTRLRGHGVQTTGSTPARGRATKEAEIEHSAPLLAAMTFDPSACARRVGEVPVDGKEARKDQASA
jgi:hypothetical protein